MQAWVLPRKKMRAQASNQTWQSNEELERALCGDANPRRLVRQNAAGAPAAMQDTFLL